MSDLPPRRPDPPQIAHVLFEDDEGQPSQWRGQRGGRDDDPRGRGLLTAVVGVFIIAIVALALVAPGSPIRVIGGGGDAGQGITAKARGDLPALPTGLEAVSRLYELSVPAGVQGPQSIEVSLREPTSDGRNLGFYAYDNGAWTRLTGATLGQDGRKVSGELPYPPRAVAVLRSTAVARSLAVIVEAGEVPDPRGLQTASAIAVRGARLGSSPTAPAIRDGALLPALGVAGNRRVYLVVGAASEAAGTTQALARPAETAAALVNAAKVQRAAGIVLELGTLEAGNRDRVTALVNALSTGLKAESLALVVAVPASGRDGGAYDWHAIAAAAEGLWVEPMVSTANYYRDVDAALAGARDAGVDLARVALVLDRRSQEQVGDRVTMITLREALSLASAIEAAPSGAVALGQSVTLRASGITDERSGGALRWDDGARSVAFSTGNGATGRAVRIENRFSAGFRLDLAARFGLGGAVMDQARSDETLGDLWDVTAAFAQGELALSRPFGPYLVPCWTTIGGGSIDGARECWKSEGGAGQVVWRAPSQPGAYTVRLVVSDGTVFVGQETSLRVSAESRTPTPTATARPGSTATPSTAAPATATPTATPTRTSTPSGPGGN